MLRFYFTILDECKGVKHWVNIGGSTISISLSRLVDKTIHGVYLHHVISDLIDKNAILYIKNLYVVDFTYDAETRSRNETVVDSMYSLINIRELKSLDNDSFTRSALRDLEKLIEKSGINVSLELLVNSSNKNIK